MHQYLATVKNIGVRIDNFLNFCLEVCKDEPTDALTGLKYYSRIHESDKMKPEDECECFMKVYEKNKIQILKGFKNDKWLHDPRFTDVVFGSKARISLENIYNCCCIIGSRNEEILSKYSSISEEKMYLKYYPEIFLFLLYSIFEYFVTASSEKRILGEHLVSIKNYIISDGGIPQAASQPDISNIFSSFGNGDLSGIIPTIMNGIKECGLIPSDKQEQVQVGLNGILEGFQKGDLQSVISKLTTMMPEGMASNGSAGKKEDEVLQIENNSNDKTPEIFDVEDIE